MNTIPCPVGSVGPFGRASTEFGLGEGNAFGYVSVTFWGVKAKEPDSVMREKNLRGQRLATRIAALVEQDDECQAIIREEIAARYPEHEL